MAYLQRLFAIMLVAAGVLFGVNPAFASRKATDLMAAALKQRAAGSLAEAISSFEYALENTTSPVQMNLARFMLGDCQIEAGRHRDAVRTFNELLESVTSPEEKAEAIYRLIQAESALGNRSRAESLFARMRREHRVSPYYELGQAFIKSEGLRMEADEMPGIPDKTDVSAARKVDPQPTSESEIADKHIPAAEVKKPAREIAVNKEVTKEPAAKSFEPAPAAVKEKASPVRETPPLPPGAGKVQLGNETTRLLRSVLKIENAEGNKEDLATRILSLQDRLKDGADKPGMDKVLLELADCTASFGELLEACKTYDQLLTSHPASPLVEKAYYEAIRLRAILGVHEAVIGWAKAFLAAFPTSEYRARVRALVEFAQAGGRVDFGQAGDVAQSAKTSAAVSGATSTASSGSSIAKANTALTSDSEYVAASQKMKDGRYNLALLDFKRLSGKHAQAPQIWWDLSLVYVQLEDFANAEKSIKQMIRLDPENQDANSLLGYIHYRLENYEEAATAYEQAGESEGRGVNFFDAKNASQRMKKTAGKRQAD